MTTILALRSGIIMPPIMGGAVMNYANEITKGIAFAFTGGDITRNLVNGVGYDTAGAPTYVTGKQGPAFTYAATTTAARKLTATTLLKGIDGDFRGGITVCILANPPAQGIIHIPYSCTLAANEWFMLFNGTKSVGTQSGSFSVGGQSGMGQTFASAIDGTTKLFSCVWSRATLSIAQLYANAVADTSVSTAAPTVLATTACKDVMGGYGNTGYSCNGYGIFLILGWNRALLPREIAELSRNPWQVFANRYDLHYDQLAAAAGGNPYRLRALMGVGF